MTLVRNSYSIWYCTIAHLSCSAAYFHAALHSRNVSKSVPTSPIGGSSLPTIKTLEDTVYRVPTPLWSILSPSTEAAVAQSPAKWA